MSQGLFRTVRSALSFAFSVRSFSAATALGGEDLSGLSSHERFAQGALIREIAYKRLNPSDMATMFAHHGFGQFREAGVREACWQASKVTRNRSLGVDLAKLYFGGNSTLSGVAERHGLSTSKTIELYQLVENELDSQQERVCKLLEQHFVEAGISRVV